MNWEWLNILRLRAGALLHRRRLERDLEDELAFHLAARAERSSELAARQAFGNAMHWKETTRDMWTFRWLEVLGQDLRYAARTLRKTPGFTTVAVLTLALGIGANTAIFSVVNAVILHPLPYPAPERLVELWGNVRRAKVERRGTSFPDYFDWRDQSRSFDGMALYTGGNFTLNGLDEPERVQGEAVAQPYFELLGVRPQLGRVFRPDEDQVPQRDAVVILSDGLWKRRFGGDPAIPGRVIQLNGRGYTVAGVMPRWFRGVEDSADLWVPLMMVVTAQDLAVRGTRGPAVLARLKPGVSMAHAQSEMDAICKDLERAWPKDNQGRGLEISPLATEIFGDIHTPLMVLLAAVGCVLLIACTNVANLLLARSEARQRELAVRMALGAGRTRMLRQLTTESLLLACTGAAAGLLLARSGVRALMAASPVTFPGYIHPAVDWQVALFTIAVSCTIGVALGLAPAGQVRAGTLFDAFKLASSHAADSRRGRRFRNVLVVAEVAVSMLLLVGAGLLIRSLQQLAAIRPGYDAAHVLALRVTLPRLAVSAPSGNADARAVITARDLLGRLAPIPSVAQAAAASDIPLAGGGAIFYTAEGQPPVTTQNMPRAYLHRASPAFFQTLHIRFIAGRTFTDEESQGSTAAIVSERLVRRFWPGEDPIGKRIKPGGPDSKSPWWTIAGVVNDMKYRGLPDNPTADPDIFLPFSERQRQFAILVRSALDPAAIGPSVRQALRAADSTAVIDSLITMEELMSHETARFRFTGWVMAIFAALALLLALIGIYGVMSYAVTRRTQEIGIRVALGAAARDVLRLVVGGGMLLIVAGLILGAAGALALTRLMSGVLYGVTATDPPTFALAGAALAVAALFACLIPAIRASRIAPGIALRVG